MSGDVPPCPIVIDDVTQRDVLGRAMPTRRTPDPSPITPEEARRRLGAAYAVLLALAAKRRTQEAQPHTETRETSAEHGQTQAT